MFEHRSERVVTAGQFVRRQVRHLIIASVLVAAALGVGAAGYHVLCGMSWIDSTHAAAMILTGMGPVAEVKSNAAKVFESAYALFSGLVFLSVASVMLAPGVHRMLHVLHVGR